MTKDDIIRFVIIFESSLFENEIINRFQKKTNFFSIEKMLGFNNSIELTVILH
jgi:hypothetical protein